MKIRYLQQFREILGPANVLTTDLSRFNSDFFRVTTGYSPVVLRPQSVSELSSLLHFCTSEQIPIIPQGGNTGMSGGQIAQKGEVVLVMDRMSKEVKVDVEMGTVSVDAGVTLEQVMEVSKQSNFLFPLDIGSKGSCQIGGNLSTHAGGLRFLRYGSLHSNTLSLEVVLPTGEILRDSSHMRKNNTGYDMKQLFIGSEGTLGVITKATIALYPYPQSIQVAFFGCSSYAYALDLYTKAKSTLNEIISAIEFMDRTTIDLVLKHIPQTRDPLSRSFPYYIVIETNGSNEGHDYEKLERLIEGLEGNWGEGVLGKDESNRKELWRLREECALAFPREGPTHTFDFSIPIPFFEEMITHAKEIIGKDTIVLGVGHMGDANLHIAVIQKDSNPIPKEVTSRLYDLVQGWKGSISAEHGIGTQKKGELWRCRSEESIGLMKTVKRLFDPKNILNPNALFV